MGKRHRNLFSRIISMDNLREAYRLTSLGKRRSLGYLLFKEQAEPELARLAAELAAGTYRPGAPREFRVYEPKPRLISAMPFRDRIVQHALHSVVGPIFERTLMGRCYACRKGKGTHAGADAVQAELRAVIATHGTCHFLKTDFRAYFASIRRAALWQEIERKISCVGTLRLIEAFTPRTGTGLPIGNLTSQLWANVYGHVFDRWLVTQGALRWHRYMDDVVILGTDAGTLRSLLHQAREFASATMGLDLSRWMVAHWQAGVNYLGYRIWPTHRLLRRSSVVSARRKLRAFARHGDDGARQRFLGAWLGHAQHASTHNLLQSLNIQPVSV